MCNQAGIKAYFPIIREASTLGEIMDPEIAKKNLILTAEQVFRLIL
jgi:glycerate kinase